jgi:hypothetical protein
MAPIIMLAASTDLSVATVTAPATSQQHVVDQDSHNLKIKTPTSWTSFRLRPDWRTDVGDSHDLFVDPFRPARQHWTLLHIQLNEACVSAYDLLYAIDPGLEEAARAVVAAMHHNWQVGGWSFIAKQCP